MSHVRLVNKTSGTPQVIPLKTWAKIQSEMPKLAKTLEFMYECDPKGDKLPDPNAKTFDELESEAKEKARLDEKAQKEKTDALAESEKIAAKNGYGGNNANHQNNKNFNNKNHEQKEQEKAGSGAIPRGENQQTESGETTDKGDSAGKE